MSCQRSWLNAVLTSAIFLLSCTAVFAQGRNITVVTEPKAVVWIDGIRYGSADDEGKLVIKNLPAGAHSLKVRADGFKEKVQPLAAATRGEVKVAMVVPTDKAELAFQEAERLGSSDRENAIAAYKKAIGLRPALPDAYIALARTQSDNGDLPDALATIKKLKTIKPGLAEASAVEARILKESGEEEKAIATFRRSITEGRGVQAEANAGLGLLYKERAESVGGSDPTAEAAAYAESSKYLKAAAKQLGTSPDAMVIYQLLGVILEKTGKIPQAIALYKEFLVLFPDTPEASAVQSFIVQLQKQP